MDLVEYRKSLGYSQEAVAAEVDLGSKAYISGLESGALKAPLRLALKLHRWSNGVVPADALVRAEDAELLQAYRRLAPPATGPAA